MKLVGLNCPVCDEPDVGFVPPCWIVCKCGIHNADQLGLWIIPNRDNEILVYPCRGPANKIEITGSPRIWHNPSLTETGQ